METIGSFANRCSMMTKRIIEKEMNERLGMNWGKKKSKEESKETRAGLIYL